MDRVARIAEGLTVAAAGHQLPLWTTWGVRDAGHLVHSLGCTFLTGVGRDLGHAAVAEVPAPRHGPLGHVQEDVRSDSVWFDREDQKVVLIAEFERYAGKQKDLGPKAETLLLAHQRWSRPDALLVLAYWTIGHVTVPDHNALRGIIHGGFDATGGVRVPGRPLATVAFFQFVVREDPDGLMRLVSIHRRGET